MGMILLIFTRKGFCVKALPAAFLSKIIVYHRLMRTGKESGQFVRVKPLELERFAIVHPHFAGKIVA